MLGCGGISEVAAFHVLENDRPRLCVAIVAESDIDVAFINARVADEDPAFARGLKLFRMKQLPRNGLGKIERLTLRAAAAAGELETA